MALNQPYKLLSGTIAAYWHIAGTTAQKDGPRLVVVLNGWESQADKDAGRPPLTNRLETFEGVTLHDGLSTSDIYQLVAGRPGWEGATAV